MSDVQRRSAVLGLAVASLRAAPRPHGNEDLPSGIADNSTIGCLDDKSLIPMPGNPLAFTAEELTLLERRFGVHGPQHGLVQLMTRGVDQLEPVRSNTLA